MGDLTPAGSERIENDDPPDGRIGRCVWFAGAMFDRRLRRRTEPMLAPVVDRMAGVEPLVVTGVGLAVGLAAAVAAGSGRWSLALAAFVVNRVIDGIDGGIARRHGRASDLGGFADLNADVVVYAAIPLGVAVGRADTVVWMTTAVLIATFYLNAVAWLTLSALLEKRGRGDRSSTTSLSMPPGLVEGAETIGFFVLLLLVPGRG